MFILTKGRNYGGKVAAAERRASASIPAVWQGLEGRVNLPAAAAKAGSRPRASVTVRLSYGSAIVDFGFRTWRPRYMPLLRSI